MKLDGNYKTSTSIANRLNLAYLLSSIGRTRADFICGVSTQEGFSSFEAQYLLTAPSFYIVCDNNDLASRALFYLKKMGFQENTELATENNNNCVFLYKKPEKDDSLYLLKLQERLEKAKTEFENYLLQRHTK